MLISKTPVDSNVELPISVKEAKEYMGIPTADSRKDNYIYSLIRKNMSIVEGFANVSMIAYVVTYDISRQELPLQYQNIASITSVKDNEGNDMAYTLLQNGSIRIDEEIRKGCRVVYQTTAITDDRLLSLKDAVLQLTLLDYDGVEESKLRGNILRTITEYSNGI